ncbi:hypothetical protein QBC32DRAFT_208988 [Pseudoneurospora amorphoporcata]|uniref:Uncharacterized protein n=1 Tax=Pseudoneurospora amorphoporcata TaxID=241081 RepID=A0AAN6SI79_9PEZI|nr:hypothetical protein QBC32DRAFT_208988 [Pseudoneurospora amorphoporcata]
MYYIRGVVRRIKGDVKRGNKGDEQVAGPGPQLLWSLVESGRGRVIARWGLFECTVSYRKDIGDIPALLLFVGIANR